jgi:hydroxymethylbilane synthase
VTLRIATRRSALALAQARLVADALGGGSLVEVTTAGDRGEAGGDKSRWVSALEEALLAGRADVAVHSAKDVPGELPAGLTIAAVPARADARDALCGARALDGLAPGARVGTSSLRRAAQLRAAREDLDVVSLRGNVDTRLRRLSEGDFDALVLAVAGLERLGRAGEAGATLGIDEMVPAPGQGALAIEARADDEAVLSRIAAIDHADSHTRLRAERALTRGLDASCRTPIGAHASFATPGGATDASGAAVHASTAGAADGHRDRLELVAFVGLPDGSAWVRDRLSGDASDPEALGRAAAERLLAAGAGDLLRAAEEAAA